MVNCSGIVVKSGGGTTKVFQIPVNRDLGPRAGALA
jgi:hypothetical protein